MGDDMEIESKRRKRWRGGTYIWINESLPVSAVVFRPWLHRRWRFRVFYGERIGTGVQSIQSFETEEDALQAMTIMASFRWARSE